MDNHRFKHPTRRRPITARRWTRPLLVAALVAGALLRPQAPLAAASAVQEARCLLGGNQTTTLVGSKAYAESFIARHTGALTRGFFEAFNAQNSPVAYTVELWDADAAGLPKGSGPLAATTLDNLNPGVDIGSPRFATPPQVTAGHRYALVVAVPDAARNGVVVALNDPCAGTFSLSNGMAFQGDPNHRDLGFSVKVRVQQHRHHHRR